MFHSSAFLLHCSPGRLPRSPGWDSNTDEIQGTGTIRVAQGTGTVRAAQGTGTVRAAQGTGTVRSAVKPPQVAAARDRRSDDTHNSNVARKLTDREHQWMPSLGSALDDTANSNELENKKLESSADDVGFPFIWIVNRIF